LEVVETIRRKDKKEGLVPRDYLGPTWVSPMSMLNDMDRLFDEFRTDWENAFIIPSTKAADMIRQPLIDLADNGKEYVVKAEMPGLNKEDLTIQVTDNGIEISGETKSEEKEEDKGYLRRERRYTKFYRALPLPEGIVADRVDAELKDGVLTVKLPKAAPSGKKAKKVQVK
jgi:HSP20 family protein